MAPRQMTQEDHQVIMSGLTSIKDFVKYAKKNKNKPKFDLEDMFYWACSTEVLPGVQLDNIIERLDMLNALIAADVISEDTKAYWPGFLEQITAAEWRGKLISDL